MSDRLAEIRARLDAAFPGPWGIMRDGPIGDGEPWVAHLEAAPGLTVGAREHTEPVARVSGYLYDVKANAAFIAHAPQDIADLLAEIERLRGLLKGGIILVQDDWDGTSPDSAGNVWVTVARGALGDTP